MEKLKIDQMLSLPVALYFIGVLLAQIFLTAWRYLNEECIKKKRKAAKLDDQILVDHSIKLSTLRRQSLVDVIILLLTVVGLPIAIVQIFPNIDKKSFSVTFLIIFAWTLFSATDIIKAFLSGVAFRVFVGFRQPFQVGDRVTLLGHSGKVEVIGPFFVRLKTLNEDQVSIPTASLWNTPLISANAGDRASLCVMTFHLAPFVDAQTRKDTEDAIWETIQSSVYWDFDKPLQIYVEQRKDEIILTAKAYVASTYNEPLFKSDVYQGFLDFADKHSVPLASTFCQHLLYPSIQDVQLTSSTKCCS